LCGAEKKRILSKSYTKGAMALCVSDVIKIGIDLEVRERRAPETIDYFVKKYSTFHIKNLQAEADIEWFYRAWTAMESYFKLAGTGFATQKDFVLDIERQTVMRDGKEIAWLEHFNIGDYLVCLCSDAKLSKQDVRLSYYGWEEFNEEICPCVFRSGV
jgi:phosphopantetheinyl transferase